MIIANILQNIKNNFYLFPFVKAEKNEHIPELTDIIYLSKKERQKLAMKEGNNKNYWRRKNTS